MQRALAFLFMVVLSLCAWPAASQGSSADQAADAARRAARENRHAEAIDAFRRAIDAAPERRTVWLLELAEQLTWSRQLTEAITLYREAAASDNRDTERRARIGLARALSWDGRHAEAIEEYDRVLLSTPKDREVRLARAQVLSWADRLGDALSAYEQILQDHPDDLQALRGKGRILSWRGRYREAIAHVQPLLRQQPNDRESTVILAESLNWMGRPDRAESALRNQLAKDPEDKRAAALLEELEKAQRPMGRIDFRNYKQSDQLRITELSLDARVPFQNGRGFAGASYAHGVFRPSRGPVEQITVQKPGIYAGYRVSDALDLNARLSADIIDTRGAEGDHVRPTFETYATYRPNDLLRFDLGASRWTFDSEKTLRDGLTATQTALSMDIDPNERTQLSARVSRATYSDGNERRWWQLQANQKLLNWPRIVIGYRYTNFDFLTPGKEGYYNPDRYNTHELLLRGRGEVRPRLHWEFRFAGGYETEERAKSRPTINSGVSLTQQVGADYELEIAYDYSTSRTLSTGGFARGITRLTLKRRF